MITAIIASAVYAAAAPAPPATFEQRIPDALARFEMVRIPAGTIDVDGKPVPVKSIWVGKTEMTWDVFDIWVHRRDLAPADVAAGKYDAESRPSRPYGAADRGFGHAGYAAIGMTFRSAELFTKWLSAKTGRKYRLPTEVEWEYAARAGATAEPAPLTGSAWFWDNAEDKTWDVGKKAPNAWGLHDVLGNTAEWAVGHDGQPVACGGGFMDKAAEVGFGARKRFEPAWQMRDPQRPKSRWWLSDAPFIGFRVVCED